MTPGVPWPELLRGSRGRQGVEGVALMTPPYRVQVFVEPGPAITLVDDRAQESDVQGSDDETGSDS